MAFGYQYRPSVQRTNSLNQQRPQQRPFALGVSALNQPSQTGTPQPFQPQMQGPQVGQTQAYQGRNPNLWQSPQFTYSPSINWQGTPNTPKQGSGGWSGWAQGELGYDPRVVAMNAAQQQPAQQQQWQAPEWMMTPSVNYNAIPQTPQTDYAGLVGQLTQGGQWYNNAPPQPQLPNTNYASLLPTVPSYNPAGMPGAYQPGTAPGAYAPQQLPGTYQPSGAALAGLQQTPDWQKTAEQVGQAYLNTGLTNVNEAAARRQQELAGQMSARGLSASGMAPSLQVGLGNAADLARARQGAEALSQQLATGQALRGEQSQGILSAAGLQQQAAQDAMTANLAQQGLGRQQAEDIYGRYQTGQQAGRTQAEDTLSRYLLGQGLGQQARQEQTGNVSLAQQWANQQAQNQQNAWMQGQNVAQGLRGENLTNLGTQRNWDWDTYNQQMQDYLTRESLGSANRAEERGNFWDTMNYMNNMQSGITGNIANTAIPSTNQNLYSDIMNGYSQQYGANQQQNSARNAMLMQLAAMFGGGG